MCFIKNKNQKVLVFPVLLEHGWGLFSGTIMILFFYYNKSPDRKPITDFTA